MHVFTSITANYLPKARVLAASVKRVHPSAAFHLVLADRRPEDVADGSGPFDSVLTVEDLSIPAVRAWAFKHTVVELCTAVKGVAACEILRRHRPGHLYYLDPDIVVLAPMDGLEAELDRASIILTPHQTVPEEDFQAIVDNEICSLKHGVYNLGFLGVRDGDEGWRFLRWWSKRLLQFCYDDIPGGLFTDQRWVDLAPAYFSGLRIIRDPQYNVATWNLTHRRATGTAPYGIRVDGRPLCFYHFSGLDSGAQKVMLDRYGVDSPVLFDLREWYLAECERQGQSCEGTRPCVWGFYDDGTPVTKAQRVLYRCRLDLQAAFPDPYVTADPGHSYRHWYQANAEATPKAAGPSVAELQAELSAIRSSRAWRAAQTLRLMRHGLAEPRRVLRWVRRGLQVWHGQGLRAALRAANRRLRG
jgi:hypothetical protein